MTFSEKLQNLRKCNGYSQEDLARELSVSRQAISKWELGTIPDINNLIKISSFFDCSLDYLLNDTTNDSSKKVEVIKEIPSKKPANFTSIVCISIMLFCLISFFVIWLLSEIIDLPIHIHNKDTGMAYMGICNFIVSYHLEPIIILNSFLFGLSLFTFLFQKKLITFSKRNYYSWLSPIGLLMILFLLAVSTYELVVGPYIFLSTFVSLMLILYSIISIFFIYLGYKKGK